MTQREPTLAGWGNLPVPGREVLSEDLEAATRLALAMETRLGFSRETPLLALGTSGTGELSRHPRIAAAVHDRLARAYGRASGIMRRRRRTLDRLSAALERDGRLDAAGIRRALGRRRPAP